jgi:hypothetical protein
VVDLAGTVVGRFNRWLDVITAPDGTSMRLVTLRIDGTDPHPIATVHARWKVELVVAAATDHPGWLIHSA